MEVINTTNKYQPLAYEVSCLYQGEIYATHLVTLWVYPQTMYLNLLEPSRLLQVLYHGLVDHLHGNHRYQ